MKKLARMKELYQSNRLIKYTQILTMNNATIYFLFCFINIETPIISFTDVYAALCPTLSIASACCNPGWSIYTDTSKGSYHIAGERERERIINIYMHNLFAHEHHRWEIIWGPLWDSEIQQ